MLRDSKAALADTDMPARDEEQVRRSIHTDDTRISISICISAALRSDVFAQELHLMGRHVKPRGASQQGQGVALQLLQEAVAVSLAQGLPQHLDGHPGGNAAVHALHLTVIQQVAHGHQPAAHHGSIEPGRGVVNAQQVEHHRHNAKVVHAAHINLLDGEVERGFEAVLRYHVVVSTASFQRFYDVGIRTWRYNNASMCT